MAPLQVPEFETFRSKEDGGLKPVLNVTNINTKRIFAPSRLAEASYTSSGYQTPQVQEPRKNNLFGPSKKKSCDNSE